MAVKVGVLALQGAVDEHIRSLESCGAQVNAVKRTEDLSSLQGFVIPGGESTTIGRLLKHFGLDQAIKERHERGMAIYGTCAGMILLAKKVIDGIEGQLIMGLMDIAVRRNAFGRQKESFETALTIKGFAEPLLGVFIRAPIIAAAGPSVETLCAIDEGIVAAREGKLLTTAFHPELTGDLRFHQYFLELCRQ